MHFSNILLPLLTLAVAAPAVNAVRINPAHHVKRTPAHAEAKNAKVLLAEDPLVAARNKDKRLVRRRKKNGHGSCHVKPTAVTHTQTVTSLPESTVASEPAASESESLSETASPSVTETASETASSAAESVTESATASSLESVTETETASASDSITSTLSNETAAETTASNSLGAVEGWANATTSVTSSETLATASASLTESLSETVSESATSSAYANATATESATSSASSASASPTGSGSWTLVEEYSGSSFFDNWDFWSYSDPTHGTVDYLSSSDSWSEGLVSINSAGHAVMSVDTTEVVTGGRKSVRLHGKRTFTGGLVIMDAYHMPTGCGTWPAWWQNGPNWPEGGEIDILEGVNGFTQNQVSLHTGAGCTIPSDTNSHQKATLTTGSYDSYNCGSAATGNQGCGARDETSDNSYGADFNSVKGGVYAMRWSKAGITVWFFQRSSIPSDIKSDSPDPSGWGTPVAHFASDSCDPYEFFYDHINIFDTTFCGDWAGADAVWNYAGYAGQSESCASSTGYSSCSDYVLNKGSAFADAYWEIASVKYFNSATEV